MTKDNASGAGMEFPSLPTPCAQIGKFLDDCTDVFDAVQMRDFSAKHAQAHNAKLEAQVERLWEALDTVLWAEDHQPDHWPDAIRHVRAALKP